MTHRSDSQRFFTLLLMVALVCGLGLSLQPPRAALAAPDYSAWNDLGIVYTPPSGRAYYPSVLYDTTGFGSGSRLYKLWYSNGSGGVFVITSTNGLNWSAPASVSGLHAGAHHVQVLYDVNCFGALPCDAVTAKYKVWYWVGTMNYAITDLATAQSVDGLTWTNATTLTQSTTDPLVTSSGWNRGTYGPISLVYQAAASNTGTNPWDYRYVMYYDGTSGGTEDTGLAYSADGLFWTAYASTPVLARGGTVWDANYATYGTVTRLNGLWHFWYSGGVAGTNEGIGYASSADGVTWTKDSGNPIFHMTDGTTHRNVRTYTPAVIDDGSGILKMYYSAVGTDGLYKIGLALNALTPQIVFVDDNWVGLSSLTQVTFPGDPDPHFIGVDAFDTITKGVNAVATGGTVKVAAGTYNENVTIGKPLTLNGAGAGDDPAVHTIINGTSLAGRGIFIQSNIANVTLSNLRVQKFTGTNGGGIYANGGNDNFTVRNTDVFTNGVAGVATGGIYLHGPVSGVIVDQVKAYSNLSRGIVIWGGLKTNITFTNNDVRYNNCCGIELQDGTASGVVISGNTVISNSDSGMAAIGLMAGAGPNLIANNTLQNNGRFGIEIKLPNGTGLESGDGSIVVSNNVVELTAPMGTLKPTELRDLAGIAVYRRGWVAGSNNVDIPTGVVVKNNTVRGYIQNAPGSVSTGFGIVVEGTNLKIYSNTVSNNDVGIQRQAGHLPYTANTNIDGDQSNVADLYFGRGNSPTVCASVSGNTTNSRNMGSVADVINLSTGKVFCSIQSAIDDATTLNDQTISVGGGTYIENITITKQLTLLGPNANIDPNTMPRQPEAIIMPKIGGVSNNASGQFIINLDAPGITIDGFTIDGDNPMLTTGNVFNGADVDVDFGIINNYSDATLPNLDAGISHNIIKNINDFGVYLYSNGTGTTNNTISHNQVDNILGAYGQGLRLADNAFGNVTDNVVTRARNAIVIENFSSNTAGTVSTVSRNTITALRRGIRFNLHYNYTTGGYTLSDNQIVSYVQTPPVPQGLSTLWVGVEVESIQQQVPVTVSRNRVDGNLTALNGNGYTKVYGTRITNGSTTSPRIDIANNTLSEAGVGLLNETPAHVLAHQNTLTANDIGASATAGGLRLISNTLSSNTTGVEVQSGGVITLAGNTLVTHTTVFSQAGGTLIAYANTIGSFTTGLINNGGSANLGHNWWGSYSDPAPAGLAASDWQARLGAPIQSWIDGSNSVTLGNAHLSGGAGTAVIVEHGRNQTNAPFGNGIAPHVNNMCSDFYDFFTVNGSGNWNVSVPVDNTADCNSQTLNPGKVFWIPYTTTYSIECTAANPACWDLITTNVVTSGQNIVVSNLSVAALGGTPFVAGSDGGNDPTAVALVSFVAVPAANDAAGVSVIAMLVMSIIGATTLLIRRGRYR
jgi:hypothetical protein